MPEFVKSYVGHSRKVTGISQLYKDKRYFISSATDKTLLLWNTDNEENKLIYSSKVEIKFISAIQDNIILIEDKAIKLINPFTKKSKTIFKSSSHITFFDKIVNEQEDILTLAVGTINGEVSIVSGKNNKNLRNFVVDGSPITSLKFLKTKNSPKLAVGTILGNIAIYEGEEFYFLIKIINTHIGEISAIEWDNREECKFFIGNNRGIVQIWSLSTKIDNKRVENLENEIKMHRESISQITFDNYNNNPTLWTSSIDTTLKAWYLGVKIEEIFELRPTNYPITCFEIILNPDKEQSKTPFSRKLLIGSNDHTIKQYEVAILNYFSLVWGLRSAIINKWTEWRVRIQNNDFPNAYNLFLDKVDIHLTEMIKENKEQLFSYIKQLFDHQWASAIKKFEERLNSFQLKTINEEEVIKGLLKSFENQISSMDKNFSQFLKEKLISDYNKHLNEISKLFLKDFINSVDENINKLIKEVTESPKIQESLKLPSFPDWFFMEINFLLKKKKLLWIKELSVIINPAMKNMINFWFQHRRELMSNTINSKEPELRSELSFNLKSELENTLIAKLSNLKKIQLGKVEKVEPVFKSFIKNKNKFIYFYDLSSQINLLPSVIFHEVNDLINKKNIEGMIEKDKKGYFFVNLKNKELYSKKEKIDKNYDKQLEKKKKNMNNLEKTIEDFNKFLEFCHLFNIYRFDDEYREKTELIRKKLENTDY